MGLSQSSVRGKPRSGVTWVRRALKSRHPDRLWRANRLPDTSKSWVSEVYPGKTALLTAEKAE